MLNYMDIVLAETGYVMKPAISTEKLKWLRKKQGGPICLSKKLRMTKATQKLPDG